MYYFHSSIPVENQTCEIVDFDGNEINKIEMLKSSLLVLFNKLRGEKVHGYN